MVANRPLWCVLVAMLASLLLFPADASAQGRRVTQADSRRTERVIRDINKFGLDGTASMGRTAEAAGNLLASLSDRGATAMRLDSVATHYTRTVSAIRIRQQARINAVVNAQLQSLRSAVGSEDLVAQLSGERDSILAELTNAENDGVQAIANARSGA